MQQVDSQFCVTMKILGKVLVVSVAGKRRIDDWSLSQWQGRIGSMIGGMIKES